jgi:hypothetical protein
MRYALKYMKGKNNIEHLTKDLGLERIAILTPDGIHERVW